MVKFLTKSAIELLLIDKFQMAGALMATGWWMYLDIPQTPNAVVFCVIIFNAAFGYRYLYTDHVLWRTINTQYFFALVGVPFLGYTHLKSVQSTIVEDQLMFMKNRSCLYLFVPKACQYRRLPIGLSIG